MKELGYINKDKLLAKLSEIGYVCARPGVYTNSVGILMPGGRTVVRDIRVVIKSTTFKIEYRGLEKVGTKPAPWLWMCGCAYASIVDIGDGRLRIGSSFLGAKKQSDVTNDPA